MITYSAIIATISMCLSGEIGKEGLCPDKTKPFTAKVSILNADQDSDCTQLPLSERHCTRRLRSIIEIADNEQLLFVLRPDGTTESYRGFHPDSAAIAFWSAVSKTMPDNLK